MNSYNITPKDAKFFVDEKNHIVTCVIEDTKYLFSRFCNKNFKINPDTLLWYNEDFTKNLEMPNRFVGQARCSENDEWNVETGKLIAFSRAKDNLNKSFFKRANTYINTLDKWIDDAAVLLNQVGDKLSINTEHRHKLITSIVGEKEE